MVTWIVVAVIVVALIVLALAVRPVLARLGGLRRAADTLTARQEQALALQAQVEALTARVAQVQEGLRHAREQRAVNAAARGGDHRAVPEFLAR